MTSALFGNTLAFYDSVHSPAFMLQITICVLLHVIAQPNTMFEPIWNPLSHLEYE